MARETREEAGVVVTSVDIVGSQPWPVGALRSRPLRLLFVWMFDHPFVRMVHLPCGEERGWIWGLNHVAAQAAGAARASAPPDPPPPLRLPAGRGGSCELMIGCIARAASLQLHMDPDEMDEVRWVSKQGEPAAASHSWRGTGTGCLCMHDWGGP